MALHCSFCSFLQLSVLPNATWITCRAHVISQDLKYLQRATAPSSLPALKLGWHRMERRGCLVTTNRTAHAENTHPKPQGSHKEMQYRKRCGLHDFEFNSPAHLSDKVSPLLLSTSFVQFPSSTHHGFQQYPGEDGRSFQLCKSFN